MKYLKFILGWIAWRFKAGAWYAGLAFRLYFAIGLDRDFNPGDDNVSREFKYPGKKSYRDHLKKEAVRT